MLALAVLLLISASGPEAQAHDVSKIVPVQTDNVQLILAGNDFGLDEVQPQPNAEATAVAPMPSVSSTRILSHEELFSSSLNGSHEAVSVGDLKHFYLIYRRYSGSYQLIRLDVGDCDRNQVSRWIQDQVDGYYKSGATLDGQLRSLGFSYKLLNGQLVDVQALSVERIGMNDELKCLKID